MRKRKFYLNIISLLSLSLFVLGCESKEELQYDFIFTHYGQPPLHDEGEVIEKDTVRFFYFITNESVDSLRFFSLDDPPSTFVYEYNENQQLSRIVSNDFTSLRKYHYDGSNKLNCIENFSSNELFSIDSFVYNPEGRLIEILEMDTGNIVVKKEHIFPISVSRYKIKTFDKNDELIDVWFIERKNEKLIKESHYHANKRLFMEAEFHAINNQEMLTIFERRYGVKFSLPSVD